jgi:hypothetical protein
MDRAVSFYRVRRFFSRDWPAPRRSAEGEPLELPDWIPWRIWRLATDTRIKDGFADIAERWTYTQVLEGNLVLDALDRAEAALAARPRDDS